MYMYIVRNITSIAHFVYVCIIHVVHDTQVQKRINQVYASENVFHLTRYV